MADEQPIPSHISPVAKERARLCEQARRLTERGFSEVAPTKLNFGQLLEAQDNAVKDCSSQFAQDPFPTEPDQEAVPVSVNELLEKVQWSSQEIDMMHRLMREGHSVQKALNDLGVDSQVETADGRGQVNVAARDLIKGKQVVEPIEEEPDTESEASQSESATGSDSAEDESESGDSEESLEGCTANLLIPEPQTGAGGAQQDTQRPIMGTDTESEPEMMDVQDAEAAEAPAGANPSAKRQFIPKPHVHALVRYYEKHFHAYKESIKPKLPSQLVPAKVWKEVYADYKQNHPSTPFKELSLKEPLRIQLRDLNKAKGQPALPEEGLDPTQDEELLTRLMSTDSFRAKGVLQERLNVAGRVAGGPTNNKRKAAGNDAEAGSPRPATSTVSGQKKSQKSVGKVTKSQNLKDAKDGIGSMLTIMTSMNEEKKNENLRRVALNEGKVALHDAKRRESEERASTLIAQRSAIDSTGKLSQINLLKEQKNLGIIDEAQFVEACKIVFFS